MTFAETLKRLRENKAISQVDLARAIEMHPSHVNRWETGKRNPPRRANLVKIARALALTPDEMDDLLVSAGYPRETLRAAAPAPRQPRAPRATGKVMAFNARESSQALSFKPRIERSPVQSLVLEVNALEASLDRLEYEPQREAVINERVSLLVSFVQIVREMVDSEVRQGALPPRSSLRTRVTPRFNRSASAGRGRAAAKPRQRTVEGQLALQGHGVEIASLSLAPNPPSLYDPRGSLDPDEILTQARRSLIMSDFDKICLGAGLN